MFSVVKYFLTMKNLNFLLPLLVCVIFFVGSSCSGERDSQTLIAGGFTNDNGKGLFLFDFDRKGNLTLLTQFDAG